jgi:hypothetical protein
MLKRCDKEPMLELQSLRKLFPRRMGMASAESIMKTSDGWQQYLSELTNARPAPAVDALQWARDPRCVQQSPGYPRVGVTALKGVVCRLWDHSPVRSWK